MLTFFCLFSFRPSFDTSFDGRGHHRQVNAILDNLLRLHYLGLVLWGAGHSVPVIGWHDYARAPGVRYGNAQGTARNILWVSSYMFITSVTSYNT
jgi:hypothetical protein